MKIQANIVNAFIDGAGGGNPAGVVLGADQLSHSQKLAIAKQVGLSETAFVSKSHMADYKLDFYTPARQIAHCGHATIAVFSYLAQQGLVGEGMLSKETIDGTRHILLRGDMAYMEQLAPRYSGVEQYHSLILNSLNISDKDLICTPKVVNTGNSFLILGVKDEQTLSQIRPNLALIETLSEKLDLIGYYVFTQDVRKKTRDAATRMFAPRYGISEEAATGMAAGPMACFLYDEINIKKDRFEIEQGYLMKPPSPSVITVKLELKEQAIASLMAGGRASSVKEIYVEL